MGDQAGVSVNGTLYNIPYDELDRVRKAPGDRFLRAGLFADLCRLNALYMIARAGSGHVGSSFSSLDIVSWLLLEVLETSDDDTSDLYFSSKGHDAPGFYAALMAVGRIPFDKIHSLRRLEGLPGHPDVSLPGIVANTGSLGMGISKAKGFVLASRLSGRSRKVFVMTGDGELQEGQIWESLAYAANHRMHEIVAIVDHNKLQSDTFVSSVSDLGDLEAKFRAFGWQVARCDGNDARHIASSLDRLLEDTSHPKVLIADTVKGKGVSFMEHTSLDSDVAMYRFHSGAPDADSYTRAARELIDRIQAQASALGAGTIRVETVQRDVAAPASSPGTQRLVQAYSKAIVAAATRNPRIVALDADLMLDTGLIPFREAFPSRFVECGIAEQDMVSMAGALARSGYLPIVHSFACFLSSRPNEQVYNNASELSRVIYVGSLAGIVPAGPGHSHQAVRDISALAGIPGLALLEPSCEAEVELALKWCADENPGSSYLRLVSIPVDVPYSLPPGYRLVAGQGVALTEGTDAALFAYGPVMLAAAVTAALSLRERGISVKVVNLPWLNTLDCDWLEKEVADVPLVFALDNHLLIGGQGDRIGVALAELRGSHRPRLSRIGLEGFPACGTNTEVLGHHRLDAVALAERIARDVGHQAV